MRQIDITNTVSVELWPGRRLYTGDLLVGLPKGAMSTVWGNQRATISFGNATRSTVSVLATSDQARALTRAIVEMERPKEGVAWIG